MWRIYSNPDPHRNFGGKIRKMHIWGFQTKDFDFIAEDVLTDNIFKKQ
jgi:hypothetical protein